MKKIISLAFMIMLVTGCGKIDSTKYINYDDSNKTVSFDVFKKIAEQDENLYIPNIAKEFDWETAEYAIEQPEKDNIGSRSYFMGFDRIKNVVSDVWISIKPYNENQDEYIETDLLYLMDKFDIKTIDDVKFYVNSGINEYGYYFSEFGFLKNNRTHFVQMFDESVIDESLMIKIYNQF